MGPQVIAPQGHEAADRPKAQTKPRNIQMVAGNESDCVKRENDKAHFKVGACLLRETNFLLRREGFEKVPMIWNYVSFYSCRLSWTGIQGPRLPRLLAECP